MNTPNIHVVTIGATNNKVRYTGLIDADGAAVDLTGATVELIYRINGARETVEMTVTDAEAGACEYQFSSDEHDEFIAGDWPMNVKVTHADTSVDYFPSKEKGSLDRELYDILRIRNPV